MKEMPCGIHLLTVLLGLRPWLKWLGRPFPLLSETTSDLDLAFSFIFQHVRRLAFRHQPH